MSSLLLFSVFVIATCGLIYELISGALASYLLGDSVTQFSTVIGVYLFSMGIGSYLSKFINKNLISVFVQVEILIGLVGGCSAAILFASFEYIASFRILLYSMVTITGTLVGLEIPLLMRILESRFDFKDLVSKVFTFDYIGALFASLLFPLILVPHLGLIRSAFLFGILNVLVATWALIVFKQRSMWAKLHMSSAILALIILIAGFILSDKIMNFAEASYYQDPIVYSKTSTYQRIIITKSSQHLSLFLNRNLQFNSRDEYRYHEALVHVGLSSIEKPKRVLILGGGDGLAAREVLKYPQVESIKLVDLDPEMTRLFSKHPALIQLNQSSLDSSKIEIINADAFIWLRENKEMYDFIIVDFPDPSNYSIGKLYTNTFYRILKQSLHPNGAIVIQSTSPFVAKKSFWSINATLKSVGFMTTPYHAYVPSFGEWGFIIATQKEFLIPKSFPKNLKFINLESLISIFIFPEDMKTSEYEVNKLNNQVLVKYFEEEWSDYLN